MSRELPKQIVIEMEPWTFAAAFIIVIFALVGVLHCIITPFLNY
jgi:hypothetical protein